MSNSIIRPSFRSSEKRKARALRESICEVQSFGFSSSSGSPFTFSPNVTSSVSTSVVKRYLLNNERISPPKSNMAEGTPLFASQHNVAIAAVDHKGSHKTDTTTLFGYSCNDDSSLASPLRRINGGGGVGNMSKAQPLLLDARGSDGTNERLCNVKKRLKYKHSDDSVDLSNTQSESASLKTLSSSSNDSNCDKSVYTDSNSETDDGTVHDEWIIEEGEAIDEAKVNISPFVKERANGIDVLDTSFTIVLSESSDDTTLDQPNWAPLVADA